MTACSWAGFNRSKMPSGSNRIGRKIPKTPGSQTAGEDIVLIGSSRCKGEPARTVPRMCRQRIHHEQAMPRNPHAQMLHKTAGSGLAAGGTGAHKGEETA